MPFTSLQIVYSKPCRLNHVIVHHFGRVQEQPCSKCFDQPSCHLAGNWVQSVLAHYMQILALNAYEAAVKAVGTLTPDGVFAGLHLDVWRDQFYRKHTGDITDTKRRAFNRARKDLVDLRRFKVEDDIYHPDGDFASFDVAMYTDIIKKRDTGQ